MKTIITASELLREHLDILGRADTGLLLNMPVTEHHTGRDDLMRDPPNIIPREYAKAALAAALCGFEHDFDKRSFNTELFEAARQARDQLEAGQASVRFAKRQLFSMRAISTNNETLIHFAPLTRSYLLSDQPKITLSGDKHREIRTILDGNFSKSEDISAQIIQIIENSWAGAPVDPRDLYYKLLVEYFWQTVSGLDSQTDTNPMLEYLTEFQRDAYEYAKGVLRQYGGVFLADVVGLGKTFIAVAILKYCQEVLDEHAVVVVPPKVKHQWEDLASEFKVTLRTVSHGKLEDLWNYQDRRILVIDESHNFRHANTMRYETLRRWMNEDESIPGRKVMLLSATPQNNKRDDIRRQLDLFPLGYERLPFQGESLEDFFRNDAHDAQKVIELLRHVVVRRTRRFIQATYPNSTMKVRDTSGNIAQIDLVFPERKAGPEQALRYSIGETYPGNLYEEILDTIRNLKLARYGVAEFVRPEFRDQAELKGISRAGSSLRGLMRILLLKRLESSVVAFEKTVNRMLAKDRQLLESTQGNFLRFEHNVELDDEEEGFDPRGLKTHWFNTSALQKALLYDIGSLQSLIEKMVLANKHAKVQRLENYFRVRAPGQHKTLIFTQFAETAEYLAAKLQERFENVEMVTGSTPNAVQIARQFAPVANRLRQLDRRIDILVATDTMSEGVNLQDADTLINFDLHWNPVRLIQRAGRIDRIGSQHEEIHIASFLPERGLESGLGLEEVLRRRIREFRSVFSVDGEILPDEELNEEEAIAAYSGNAFEEDEAEDLDSISRHSERLLLLRRENQEAYDRVVRMRPGRTAVSNGDGLPIAALRLGWFWKFFTNDESGGAKEIPHGMALDLAWEHAEAGKSKSNVDIESAFELGRQSRDAFIPLAMDFRAQRTRPRLSGPESKALSQLQSYRQTALETEKQLLERIIAWVEAGGLQQHRAVVRGWGSSPPLPVDAFRTLRVLAQRFSLDTQELGTEHTLGIFLGDR